MKAHLQTTPTFPRIAEPRDAPTEAPPHHPPRPDIERPAEGHDLPDEQDVRRPLSDEIDPHDLERPDGEQHPVGPTRR